MKKRYFFSKALLLLTFGVFYSQSSFSQVWTYQDTDLGGYNVPIVAVDENTIWSGNSEGFYIRSIDGGKTWPGDTIRGALGLDVISIAAIDRMTAYYLAVAIQGGDSRIYKTTDGGATWAEQYRFIIPGTYLNAIAFWDEQHGIAIGDPISGAFFMVRTTNGGLSWQAVPATHIPAPCPGEWAGIYGGGGPIISTIGDKHAWFGGAYGQASSDSIRVFRTNDQGLTWSVSSTPISMTGDFHGISSVVFADTLNGYVGGGNFGIQPQGSIMAKTTDGGKTWSAVPSFPSSEKFVYSLAYIPHSFPHLLIANVDGGGSFVSKNSGDSWAKISDELLYGLTFVNPITGWSGSDNGMIATFNGNLLTISSLDAFASGPSREIQLLQNYPNPFSQTTTIQFEVKRRSQIRVKVFDLTGKEIALLKEGMLGKGIHEVVWDAADMPNGAYFYRLEAGEASQARLLTILR